jgi:hypothetical protein
VRLILTLHLESRLVIPHVSKSNASQFGMMPLSQYWPPPLTMPTYPASSARQADIFAFCLGCAASKNIQAVSVLHNVSRKRKTFGTAGLYLASESID